MEEDKEKLKTVVINSNILFSSLIKEEGFTRAVLIFLKEDTNLRFLIPKKVTEEFKLYHIQNVKFLATKVACSRS